MSTHQFEPNSTRFAAPGTTANVYVSGLPERYNDYQLRSLFEQFGKVESAKMMCYSANSNKPRGTGFVLFNNSESPVAAVKALNKSVLEGQTIEVCFAKAHRQGHPQQQQQSMPAPTPLPVPQPQQGPAGGFQVQGSYDNPVMMGAPLPQQQVPLPAATTEAPKTYAMVPQQQQQPISIITHQGPLPQPQAQQPQQQQVVVVQQVVQPNGQIMYVMPAGAPLPPQQQQQQPLIGLPTSVAAALPTQPRFN